MVDLKAEAIEACECFPDVIECLAFMYEHVEDTDDRRGALVFATVDFCQDSGQYSLRRESTLASPGVYDLAWGPEGVLVAACADGCARLYSQTGVLHETFSLSRQILTHICFGVGVEGDGLAVVGQEGKCYHLKLAADGLQKLGQQQQHDLEAWCVDVSPAEPALILSGADDGHLAAWDTRSPSAVLRNRRAHEAGVTALAFNPFNPLQVASGSYDERLRLFDLRRLTAEPLGLTGRLGDGAYQISWHPSWCGVLAVAAMRCGFPVFSVNDGDFKPLATYASDAPEGAHGSLGYGVAWQFGCSEVSLAASASFYDRSVHLWSARDPESGEPTA